jgi:hypothetical protein
MEGWDGYTTGPEYNDPPTTPDPTGDALNVSHPFDAFDGGAKVLAAVKEVIRYGGPVEKAIRNGEAALSDLRGSTPPPLEALRAGDRILMLLGGYRDYMEDEAVQAFQCLAAELSEARTPPPVSLDEVAEEAFLSGFCAARGIDHVTELAGADYHAAHIASQDYLTRSKERQ